jgi:hypothetical protein
MTISPALIVPRTIARNMNAKPKEGELGPKEIEALLAKHRPEWNKFASEFGDVAKRPKSVIPASPRPRC